MSRRGPAVHIPTSVLREKVKRLAGFGVQNPEIAKAIGISHPTLMKYYAEEIIAGPAETNAKVAEALYLKALSGERNSVQAAIFWLKCRAGWRELPPPPAEEAIGKKEQANREAVTAARGTDWEQVLQ